MKPYKTGYTSGTFDMFHIGHLNILRNAKKLCDKLIVAVSTDELVQKYKNKKTIIPFEERKQIVEAIKYVDLVIPQFSLDDKLINAQKFNIDVMFVGDDWKGTDKWNKLELDLKAIGIEVVYLKHTEGISSTILRSKINN